MNTTYLPDPPTALPGLEYASVGAPITRVGVSLIPIYIHRPVVSTDADLARRISTGNGASVTIGEQPEAEVPTLLAENHGDALALLVSGQIVEGGLQTRVLNVSVLIDGRTKLPIPVSCVEQGRWNGGSEFRPGVTYAPRRVRRAKDETVADSVRSSGSKRTNQGRVWDAVSSELTRMRVSDDSHCLSAAAIRFEDGGSIADAVSELRTLGPLPGQCGIVVAHGKRIVSVEVFATPELLAAHWDALVSGILLDAPNSIPSSRPSLTHALRFVRRLAAAEATVTPGVGLGREHHVRTKRLVGQALVHDNLVVHASAFALAA